MAYQRTIILNSVDNKDSRKAILTLKNENEAVSGEIKLYNFDNEVYNLALGISVNDNVIKVPAKFTDHKCSFKTNKYINLDEKITCAIVDLNNLSYPQIVLGGTTTGGRSFDAVEAAFIEDAPAVKKPTEAKPMPAPKAKIEPVKENTPADNAAQTAESIVPPAEKVALPAKEEKPAKAVLQDDNLPVIEAAAEKKPVGTEEKNYELYDLTDADDIETIIDKEFLDGDIGCDICTGCKYRQAFYASDDTKTNKISKEEELTDYIDKYFAENNIENPPPVKVNIKQEISDYKKQDDLLNDKIQADKTYGAKNTAVVLDNSPKADEVKEKKEEKKLHQEEKPEDFYGQIKGQLAEIFKNYTKEDTLEKIIPNSKWAKINYEDDDSFYVLGLIYENEVIKYIAYGLPSAEKNIPPKDLKEYAQWVPLDTKAPDGQGYWVVYQDAASGESIVLEVI